MESQTYHSKQVPVWFRAFAGVVALSGSPFLLTIIWFITLPGALIWLCWIAIAFGGTTFDRLPFWLISSIWTIGMAVFVIGEDWPGPYRMHFGFWHVFAAVMLSLTGGGRCLLHYWLGAENQDPQRIAKQSSSTAK